MLRSIIVVSAAVVVFALGPELQPLWADEGRGEHGTMMGRSMGYGYGRGNVEKASHFLRHLLTHRQDIGLTADQVGKLKALQLDLRRARFRGEAEIEIEELELQSLLENDTSDLGRIEAKLKLIEDLQKALRMKAIKARREARLLLTPAQRAKWEAAHEKMMEGIEPGVSGTWQGALSSQMKDGEADISWTIYQSGQEVSGRFVCSGGTLKCSTAGGAITGTLAGGTFTGRMIYTDSHLCGLVGRLSGTSMQGEYSCNDKLGEDRGTWRMSWEAPGPPRSP
jgi:Spy/CpxP family protein refolding chaperone